MSERLLREVGRRIAELRLARGETQEGLAERLRITGKYLQRVERGGENLTLRTLGTIARALGVAPLSLLVPPISERSRDGRPPTRVGRGRIRVRTAPRPEELFRTCVPLLTLIARAGEPDAATSVEVDEWIELAGRRIASGSFVARVRGDSMPPPFDDGALALFRAPARAPLEGKIVLVRHSSVEGGAYLVKTLTRSRQGRARLVSGHAAVAPIDVDLDDDAWSIVAELIEVLDRAE